MVAQVTAIRYKAHNNGSRIALKEVCTAKAEIGGSTPPAAANQNIYKWKHH